MVKKIFHFHGKTIEELKELSLEEFAELIPSRQRRSIKRNSEIHKKILKKVKEKNEAKTHLRDAIVVPGMVGKTIKIHNGKEFVPVIIQEDMLGCFLGELAMTRRKVNHSAPGIGATKSSSSMSMK
ncbi:MAG: 30S ribosomal protein S19 [Candidatus Woesearchaeota archaeon]